MSDGDQLLAVQRIGENTTEQAEDDEWQSLKKSGQAELHRRTGQLVNLVEARDVAHIVRCVGAENRDENEPVIADQERRPGANRNGRVRLGKGSLLKG
jgi:hypothetical protein